MRSKEPAVEKGDRAQNRLALEKSPYLLQHAGNPVNWYPWSEEAFSKAREEDKPVFLSIGYSSCHWCHVMEEESFRDDEVATSLNDAFVSIKVDREERPDIDYVYMSVCQALTGSGGWPLTILMTAEKKPFFAGTYFPKRARLGLPGLLDLLGQVADLWKRDRTALTGPGERVAELMRKSALADRSGRLGLETIEAAYRELVREFDDSHGGFGNAPKFPSPHNLSLLLRWWKRTGDGKARDMVERTLNAMWKGGINDHLGHGFHRYSTDARWLLPHFEKMLYDQAMLAIACVETFQATGNGKYRKMVDEIFTYVLRDMTSPEGAFYSSEDADSEGEEGRFYTWTPTEVKAVLGERRGDVFSRFFGIDEAGDLEGGRSVLHRFRSAGDFARDLGIDPGAFEREIEQSARELFACREGRERPSRDDKILTDWNGLMIAALAKASQAFGESHWARSAARAVRFLMKELRSEEGRLLHRYREGEAAIPAFLDDYAFLVWGLIELYEATFDPSHLAGALSLTDEMLRLFRDENGRGFFFTADDGEELLARQKTIYDGAIPAGNSIAALDLQRLGRLCMREDLEDRAGELFAGFGGAVEKSPASFAQLLIALDFSLGPVSEIVVAGERGDEVTERLLGTIRRHFLPRAVVLFHPDGDGAGIEQIVPFLRDQGTVNGRAAVYVCENFSCTLPVQNEPDLISLLQSLE